MSDKLIITYEEYKKVVEKLALEIEKKYKPTVLVGIMRGAAPIIDILSRIFKLPTAYVVIQSYSGDTVQDKQGELIFARDISAIATNEDFKNVLLVDDSIVRGTTSKEIVQMAKEAGAKRVYIASAAPPVRHPNVYGIDMPSVSELIAYDRNIEEVAITIGADWLVYQDIDDLISSAQKGNKLISEFDASCFTGKYVTGDIDADYLARLESLRNDAMKESQNIDEGLTDLTNNQ